MFIVYRSTNLINNKKYIGADSHNNPLYFGSGIKIENALKKYGKSYFKKEILEKCFSEEEMYNREKYWTIFYDAVKSEEYYNISEGGKGGNKLNNPESYNKWLKNTPDIGEYSRLHFKGKTYEEIYGYNAKREKTKRKESLEGVKHTETRKNNIGASLMGKAPWNKGLTKEDKRVQSYVKKNQKLYLKINQK